MSGAEVSGGSVDSASAAPLELSTVHDHSKRSSTRHKRSLSISSEDRRIGKQSKAKKARTEPGTGCTASQYASLSPEQAAKNPTPDYDEVDYIQDPLTGLRIYRGDSVAVAQRICANPFVQNPSVGVQWKVKEKEGTYVCRMKVPDNMPIKSFKSPPAQSASEAETNACFRLCRELFNWGLLDQAFFPRTGQGFGAVYSSEDCNPEVAKSSSTTRRYTKKRPLFLTNALLVGSHRLYPLIVSLGTLRDQYHAPMLILARVPFPQLAGFKLFSAGESTVVSLRRGSPFLVTPGEFSLLHRYTLRVSRSVLNKPFECASEDLPFLFAPLNKTWEEESPPVDTQWQLPMIQSYIPWRDVEEAVELWATDLLGDGEDLISSVIEDCIVQDRAVEFTNRHLVVRARTDLSPLSKPEDGVREEGYDSFLEYCKARRKDFEGLRNPEQPMLEVSQIASTANHLAPTCGQRPPAQPKNVLKYLIPELCRRFTIPASTFRTALLLPSITHMLERMLLAKELNAKYFNSAITDEHLLAALSPPMANVEYNYERLELLGDAYLKYLVSAYLYATMPGKREGPLNHVRGQVVSNKALHAGALNCALPQYIQSKSLSIKVWQPHVDKSSRTGGNSLTDARVHHAEGADSTCSQQGKGGKRKKQLDDLSIQWLGDKTVADVVEAILGAALISGGYDLAFNVAKVLHIDIPKVHQWLDIPRLGLPEVTAVRGALSDKVQVVELITGHQFEQPTVLLEALTHSSVNGAPNYERLEFLGDAVLDMLAVSYIFDKYTLSSPGTLTLLKSAMVSNQALATLCVLTGLHKTILYGGDMGMAIAAYAQRINILKDQEYKRANAEGRLPGQFWLEAEPPKVLSDVVESVLGAVFISAGYDIGAVQTVFNKICKPFYLRHIRLQTLSPHPATTLLQLFQAEHCQSHSIQKEADDLNITCAVVVHGIRLADGTDRSSNIATRKAASAALDALAGDPGFMSRNCDCRVNPSGAKVQKQSDLGYDDEANTPAVE
ncbi:ribonuclease III [Trametopsis cervina]|nr:ribonuclease III [Trametopsis cervina]